MAFSWCRSLPPIAPAFSPPPVVKLRLVCQNSLASPREIVVEQFPIELGRGSEAALRIDDRWLSRRHCRIDVAEGVLLVRDLGSRHGTYVNGQCVAECKLLPGHELRLGLTHFVAEYEPEGYPLPRAQASARIGTTRRCNSPPVTWTAPTASISTLTSLRTPNSF